MAVIDVLDRCGVRAEYPRAQTCCGQPFFNAGYRPEARRLALATARVLEPYDAVVVPSGSCAAMIRMHYPELFAPATPIATWSSAWDSGRGSSASSWSTC